MRLLGELSVVLSLAALLLACGGSENMAQPLEPKLSVLKTQVFDISCAFSACHDTRSAQMGLILQGDVRTHLLAMSIEQPTKPIVKPGDPDGSFVMDKLLNRNLPAAPMGEVWTSMPPGPQLEAERLEAIRAWIEAGAMDD